MYTWEDIYSAIALLVSGRLNLDGIVSRVVSLEEAPSAIARLREGADVKILVDPRA
jgi:threonine dehydrogenase-like Zn-dependent dehydrogenase